MRPLYLWIALAVLAAGLAGVWALVIGAPGGESLAAAAMPGPAAVEPGAALAAEAGGTRGDEEPGATGEASRARTALVAAAGEPAAALEELAPAEPTVTGRVVDPAGEPVAGATVHASTGDSWFTLPLDVEAEGLPRRWRRARTVETGADGRFAIEGLSPGRLSLVVLAHGFAPHREAHGDLTEEAPLADLGDVRLAVGARVAGTIVDPTGRGVAGVAIVQAVDGPGTSLRLEGRGVRVGTSAEDGSFVVDELAPGPWTLDFDAPGYRVARREGRTSDGGPPLYVRLEDGDEIRGRVVDAPPEIAATLRISARRRDRDGRGGDDEGDEGDEDTPERARHATCAADGTFAIGGLDPYQSYRLTAWKPNEGTETGGGWARAGAVRTATAESGATGVELEYRPRAELVFRVVDDESGAPLEELDVWVGVGRLRHMSDDDGAPIREHADGRVVCDELSIGGDSPAVKLRVVAAGHRPYEDSDLLLAPAERRDLGELRLVRAASLVVRAVGDDGEPVEGARVAVRDEPNERFAAWAARAEDEQLLSDPRIVHARTGADGRARVAATPGVTHYVVVVADDFLPSDETLVPLPSEMPPDGEHEREVVLRRGGTARVRVVDPTGVPVADVRLRHRRPGESIDEPWRRSRELSTRDDGTVELRGLEPGVHGFAVFDAQASVAWGRGGVADPEDGWREAVVSGGETVEIELVAPPRFDLFGVVRENGRPVEGVALSLRPADEPPSSRGPRGPDDPLSTRTDHDGRYALAGVREGRYELLAGHSGRSLPERFAVELFGRDRELDLELPGTAIEGRVTDPNGTPLAGVEVRVRATSGVFSGFRPYRLRVGEDDRGSLRRSYDRDEPEPTLTGSDGTYVLYGVAADEELVVEATDPFLLRRRSDPLRVAPGAVRRDVDFELPHAGRLVLTLKGNAEPRGWYSVRATRTAERDKGGKVRTESRNASLSTWSRRRTLDSLRPGSWRVELLPDRRASSEDAVATQEVEVKAGETAHAEFRL